MDNLIPVYESRPIPAANAAWLQKLLDPFRIACRLPPIPLELRPMAWDSLCCFDEVDSRVALSNRAIFWDKKKIVIVYLHEVAHRLRDQQGLEVAHGVEFFTLLLSLQMRAHAALADLGGYRSPLNNLSYYDHQEVSPVWSDHGLKLGNEISVQFEWAREHALNLAMSDMDAASIAKAIPGLWVQHVKKLSLAKNEKGHEKQVAAKRIEELESSSWFYRRAFFATLFLAWIGLGFALAMNI